jgi:hypothetical protein
MEMEMTNFLALLRATQQAIDIPIKKLSTSNVPQVMVGGVII